MAEAWLPSLAECGSLGPVVYAYLFKASGWCKHVHVYSHSYEMLECTYEHLQHIMVPRCACDTSMIA